MKLPCRLCLSENSKDNLNNVFNYNIKHCEDSLVDLLFWVFAVEIDATDPYGKDICKDCMELIEYVVEVRNTFQKNQVNLRKHHHGNTCGDFEIQLLDSAKETKNGKTSTENCTTSKKSPSSKHSYKRSSQRVGVDLATLKTLCPLSLCIQRWENDPENMYYKQIEDGTFKKRKYRHFNIDEKKFLDGICSSLDEKSYIKSGTFKKDIGTSTELYMVSKGINTNESSISNPLSMVSKAVNTDESRISTSLTLSWTNDFFEILPIMNLPCSTNNKIGNNQTESDDSTRDIIKLTNNISSSLSSTEVDRDFDWTHLTFKKDVSTNTEYNSPKIITESIDVNVQADPVESGTINKAFKQITDTNIVKIKVQTLNHLSPNVWLEPVEYLMERENYKEIEKFSFMKDDALPDAEQQSSHAESDQDYESQHQHIKKEKKQRFLDYYNNFSSFAVRELIAGKNIREPESESNTMFKVSNVCSVFVCDFCSKSFLTQTSLNLHCNRTHKSIIGDVSNISCDSGAADPKIGVLKKRRRRRKYAYDKPKIKPLIKNGLINISSIKKNNMEDENTDVSKGLSNDHGEGTSEKVAVHKVSNNVLEKVKRRRRNFTAASLKNVECSEASSDKSPLLSNEREEPTSGQTTNINNGPIQEGANNFRINNVSRGLRKKVEVPNYNIDKIIRSKTRFNKNSPKTNVRRRGRRKQERQIVVTKSNETDTSYIWDRKRLGTYSAITFYKKNPHGEDTEPALEKSPEFDSDKKRDFALNETIRKLAGRLDELENEKSGESES